MTGRCVPSLPDRSGLYLFTGATRPNDLHRWIDAGLKHIANSQASQQKPS